MPILLSVPEMQSAMKRVLEQLRQATERRKKLVPNSVKYIEETQRIERFLDEYLKVTGR